MLDASLEEVLGSENDIISPGDYDALFTEYAARQAGSMSAASVEGMVRDIVVAAQSIPKGWRPSCRRRRRHRPASLWRAWRLWRAISRRCARPKSRERLVMRSSTVRPVRSRGTEDAQQQGAEPSPEQVLELFNAFPVPSRAFGTSEYKEYATEAAQGYLSLMMEARLALAEPRDARGDRLIGSCLRCVSPAQA